MKPWINGALQRARRWIDWRPAPSAPAGAGPLPPAAAQREAPPVWPRASCVSVVIPALNESRRIASVVAYALADPATAEVIVVDDSSIDDTVALARQAGARVVTSTMLGKGPSMQDGLLEARHDFVVYLDGDLTGLQPGIVGKLCAPLARLEADFVKARFGRGGGRVTELTAKPMLKVFFPELAVFGQPLGGIIAARRTLLQQLSFEDGYGVDIGLLVDAHRAGARMAEVDIGSIEHDSQPLPDLTVMANEVARVIYSRAKAAGRLHAEQITAMFENQRQAAAALEYVLTRRRGRQRLLLIDMDGTLTTSRFALELARAAGQEDALAALLDNPNDDAATRGERIAALYRFVHKQQFERVARASPIRPGAIEFVNRMRRAGFMVGVLSDSYFIAADIVRRRVFADFALAHMMQFEADVCSGQVRLNPAFLRQPGSDDGDPICKSHVLRRFRSDDGGPPLLECWAIGDNANDLGLLRLADRGFVIDPKSPALRDDPSLVVIESFDELLPLVPGIAAPAPAAPPPDPSAAA